MERTDTDRAVYSPLADNQQVVGVNASILERHGIGVTREDRILDFGCGSGRHTYEYLDAGYAHTSGFDIDDYVELRDPQDRDRFRFLSDPSIFRLPFPDDEFDLVASTQVFEHVGNLDESIQEIARVLKPTGATLHLFPSRLRPIEPHMFVPFAGAVQSPWWFRLWAQLGIRNGYQEGLSTRETVQRNLEYCRTGVHYPPFSEIDAAWRGAFQDVQYVELDFLEASKHFSRVSRIVSSAVRYVPTLIKLYRACHFRVILARRPGSAGQLQQNDHQA